MRWDHPTHYPDQDFVDVDGVGRYLVRREARGSRVFRAYLNGSRTAYCGSRAQARAAVERAVAQAAVIKRQQEAEF